jgi:hypothetical protein
MIFNFNDLQGARSYNFLNTIDMLQDLIKENSVKDVLDSCIFVFTNTN